MFLLLFCFPLNYNFGIEGSLFGAVFLFTESVRSVRGVTVLEAGRKMRFACINTDKQGAGEQQYTGGAVEGLSPRRVMAHTFCSHQLSISLIYNVAPSTSRHPELQNESFTPSYL